MTTQSIIYRKQDIELALTTTEETVRVPGFVAEGTGLGYYIDEAPGDSSSSLYELTTGLAYQNYYVLVHLASGRRFGWHVYTEPHVHTWLERVATFINWTLPLERILALPEWQMLQPKVKAVLDEVTKTTKRARASK